MHKTGDIHGVLPAHVGMEVRFTAVQEELKSDNNYRLPMTRLGLKT